MKNKVIIVTHGAVSVEFKETCSNFFGLDNISAIVFKDDMSIEMLSEEIEKKICDESINYVLTDIYSGTPFNVSVLLKNNYKNLTVASGVNLAMVLSICTGGDYILDAKESIRELK